MQLYNTTYNGATSSKEQQNMMTFQVQTGETKKIIKNNYNPILSTDSQVLYNATLKNIMSYNHF